MHYLSCEKTILFAFLFRKISAFSIENRENPVTINAFLRPTLDDFDWASRSFKAEEIEISSRLRNGTNISLVGFYVIGVFGFQNSTYSIVASVGNYRLMEVLPGQPVDISLDEEDVVYLEYFNRYNNSFKIILSQSVGSVDVFVKQLPSIEMNVLTNLPDYSKKGSFNELWTSKSQGSKDMLVIRETDKDYCTECRYLIGIKAKTKAHLSASVYSENVPVMLQPGRTFQDYIEKEHFMKFSYINRGDAFDLTIVVYSGLVECYLNSGPVVSKEKYVKKITQASKDSKIINEIVEFTSDAKFNNLLGSRISSLMVLGLESSNYSIMVRPAKSVEKSLRYGILDYNALGLNEQRNFSFLFTKRDFYPDKRKDKITFTILLGTGQALDFPSIQFLVSSNEENKTSFQEKTVHEAKILKTQKYGRLQSFELLAEEGTYKAVLRNNASSKLINFTVMLSAREMNVLMPNWETVRFLGLGFSDYYQIYAQNSSLLLIEVFECAGGMQVSATKNYEFLINGVYDMAVRRHEANHIALVYEVDEGPVYLNLKGVEGLKMPTEYLDKELSNNEWQEQALYKLYATVIDKRAGSPYDLYYPGDNGRLTWKVHNDGVQVKLPALRKSDSSGWYVPNSFTYKMYLSENEQDLESATKCGGTLPFSYFQKFKTLKFEVSFEPSQHNFSHFYVNITRAELDSLGSADIFYLNSVCEVKWNSSELVESSKFIYTETEVVKSLYMNSSSSHSASKVIIIVVLLLLILLTIGSVIIFKRYKKMKARLQFELQDVRNVASLEMNETKIEEVTVKNEKGENKKVLYQGFLEEGV